MQSTLELVKPAGEGEAAGEDAKDPEEEEEEEEDAVRRREGNFPPGEEEVKDVGTNADGREGREKDGVDVL